MNKILVVNSYSFSDLIEGITTKELVQQLMKDGKESILFYSINEDQLAKINKSFSINNGNSDELVDAYENPILGYNSKTGLIKISDPNNMINGTFTINNNRILYDPNACGFTGESDAYTYSYSSLMYFTTEPIDEILKQYIFDGRECCLNNGSYFASKNLERLEPNMFYNEFVKKPLNIDEECLVSRK